jgi:predicted Fe-S protein YdhL (DUF1289 family)
MTDYDAVAELAARMTEKYCQGEEPGFEDRLAWDGLTDEERDRFMADSDQQIAHGMEKLEALQEDNRILKILLRLDVGLITPLQAVHQIRGAVPDPLVGQRVD